MIHHLATNADWALNTDEGYVPAGYEAEGFIHCSSPEQLAGVVERYYQGRSDLHLLTIDPERLSAELVWENTSGGTELFPHLYGRLNLDAIVERVPFDANGGEPIDL